MALNGVELHGQIDSPEWDGCQGLAVCIPQDGVSYDDDGASEDVAEDKDVEFFQTLVHYFLILFHIGLVFG